MTHEERAEFRKRMIFPRERLKQKATDSPEGAGKIHSIDRGFPRSASSYARSRGA